jgi:hypothetical protein
MPNTRSPRDDAHTRATEAATRAAALRADLDALKRQAKPARAALRARDAAAERVAELRRDDASRRGDALARGQKAGKPSPAIAEAEKALAAAQDEADAADALLSRLRERADAIRADLAAAEAKQRDAAAALAAAEHRAASAEWDSAVEALGPIMTRMDAAEATLSRLRVSLREPDAASLRRALRQDGLCLASWGQAGRARPRWLHEADREAVADGAARILAVAGLPADLHVPEPSRELIAPSTIGRPTISVTQGEAPLPAQRASDERRVVDFGPGRVNSVRITRDGVQ